MVHLNEPIAFFPLSAFTLLVMFGLRHLGIFFNTLAHERLSFNLSLACCLSSRWGVIAVHEVRGSTNNSIVVPGFGSRKRVADTLGNLPERLAAAFDGNLAILHFDK